MSHMDFNIAAALHLASQGEGRIYNEDSVDVSKVFLLTETNIVIV